MKGALRRLYCCPYPSFGQDCSAGMPFGAARLIVAQAPLGQGLRRMNGAPPRCGSPH